MNYEYQYETSNVNRYC